MFTNFPFFPFLLVSPLSSLLLPASCFLPHASSNSGNEQRPNGQRSSGVEAQRPSSAPHGAPSCAPSPPPTPSSSPSPVSSPWARRYDEGHAKDEASLSSRLEDTLR
jgi:hypothetical protein